MMQHSDWSIREDLLKKRVCFPGSLLSALGELNYSKLPKAFPPFLCSWALMQKSKTFADFEDYECGCYFFSKKK